MLKKFKKIIPSILISLLLAGGVSAITYYYPEQGGTGTKTLPVKGDLLVGTSNRLYTILSSSTDKYLLMVDNSATNGLSWTNTIGSASNRFNAFISALDVTTLTVSGTAAGDLLMNDNDIKYADLISAAYFNATSTTRASIFKSGFVSQASSTIVSSLNTENVNLYALGGIYMDAGGSTETYLVQQANGKIAIGGTAGISAILDVTGLTTSDKTFTFPNLTGTFLMATGTQQFWTTNNLNGFGTSTPRYTLDVWGDMAVGTSSGTGAPQDYPLLYVQSGTGGTSNGIGIGTTTVSGTMLTVGTTTPAFVVSQTGNVGIGTATPGAPLEIFSTASQIKLSYDGTNNTTLTTENDGDFRILPSGSYFRVGKATVLEAELYMNGYNINDVGNAGNDWTSTALSSVVPLQVNSSSNSYFTGTGNVGIATSTPRYTLDVWGDLAIGTSSGTGAPQDYPLLYVQSGTGGTSNGVGIGTTTVSGTMLTVGTTTPAFVISQTGNVGIGTASPLTKLELGSGQISVPIGSVTLPSYTFAGDTDTGIWGRIADYITFSSGALGQVWEIDNSGNFTGSVSGQSMSTKNTDASSLLFSARNSGSGLVEVARLQGAADPYFQATNLYSFVESGNVGIATTTPALTLDVSGMMRAYKTTTSTCNATIEGGIFFNQTDKIGYMCDGSVWRKLW